MKKISFLILIFSILIGSTSYAHDWSYGDWPRVINWNNGTNPCSPPVYNHPYDLNYSNYYVPNYTSNFDCKSINIPTPQVVYDVDGIIPIGNFIERAGSVYFCYLNGVFARNTWLKTKGKWYYFDISSEMLKGFVKINGLTYYFNSDGSMATGTTTINGVTHYFDATGAMVF